MRRYRNALPQLDGTLYLTDAGLETDLIFNHGIEIPAFAAHTLLDDQKGRHALIDYFEGFVRLAAEFDAGLILDTVTWKAHRHWQNDVGQSMEQIVAANRRAVELIVEIRDRADNTLPIVLNAPIGPRGDAYRPERVIEASDARSYYREQLGWLKSTAIDMVTGLTFNQASEAEGLVAAAHEQDLPVVISFTVETDGRLPTGQPLWEAIEQVDTGQGGPPAYFMINCAHPEHFDRILHAGDWRRRLRGIRANASRCSHAELDEAPELDPGDPLELASQYRGLKDRLPWLNVFGACCGADLRHVRAIASALADGSAKTFSRKG